MIDNSLFSDLYKDVHGFRPKGHVFYSSTPSEKKKIIDDLQSELDRMLDEQHKANSATISRLLDRMRLIMQEDDTDEITAFREILVEKNLDRCTDHDYILFMLDLPYTNPFSEAIKTITAGNIASECPNTL